MVLLMKMTPDAFLLIQTFVSLFTIAFSVTMVARVPAGVEVKVNFFFGSFLRH